MKIRFKTGEVLDLRHVRETSAYEARKDSNAYFPARMLQILDALEAALSVGCDCNTVFEASYVGGYKTALDDVRQAAGVVE